MAMFLVDAIVEKMAERSFEENHERRMGSDSDCGQGFLRKRRVLRTVLLL